MRTNKTFTNKTFTALQRSSSSQPLITIADSCSSRVGKAAVVGIGKNVIFFVAGIWAIIPSRIHWLTWIPLFLGTECFLLFNALDFATKRMFYNDYAGPNAYFPNSYYCWQERETNWDTIPISFEIWWYFIFWRSAENTMLYDLTRGAGCPCGWDVSQHRYVMHKSKDLYTTQRGLAAWLLVY